MENRAVENRTYNILGGMCFAYCLKMWYNAYYIAAVDTTSF